MKKIIISIIMCTSLIWAQGYQDVYKPFWYMHGFGTDNFSAANNGVAMAMGVAALSQNPANIALNRSSEVVTSFQMVDNQYNSQLGSGNEWQKSNDNRYAFNGFGMVLPIEVYQGSMAFGISYSPIAQYNERIVSDGIYSLDDGNIYIEQNLKEFGQLNAFRMAWAVEFQKDIFIGTSFNIYSGYKDYYYIGTDQDSYGQSGYYDYYEYTMEEEINQTYGGWNFSLGMLYRMPKAKWAVAIETPLKLRTEEDYWFYEVNEDDDGVITDYEEYTEDPTKYYATLPFKLTTGISTMLGKTELCADATFMNWHSINFESDLVYYDTLGIAHELDPVVNDEIHINFKSTLDLGFAASHPISDNAVLTIGYKLVQNPFYDIPNNQKFMHILGFGVDYQLGQWIKLNAGYQARLYEKTIYNSLLGTDTNLKSTKGAISFSAKIFF